MTQVHVGCGSGSGSLHQCAGLALDGCVSVVNSDPKRTGPAADIIDGVTSRIAVATMSAPQMVRPRGIWNPPCAPLGRPRGGHDARDYGT